MKVLRIPQISAEEYIEKQIVKIRETVGGGRVLLALSGGVDCSVSAALLSKAGVKLTCILVDHGFMRKNEANEVKNAFADWDLELITVDAEERFLAKVKGVSEPEQKRKLIGEEFIRVFEEQAKKIGVVDFLAQGTIYTDVIESENKDGKAAVKSHHNVGGLPESIKFKGIIEPVRELYKNEVREISAILGLPDYITKRQPFPGPGLAIRVIGEVTKERLDVLRDADYIYREEIAAAGLNTDINQYFAVLTDMRSVGVKDGMRTYGYIAALRAVNTVDLVTARFARLPYEVLEKVSARITSEVVPRGGIGISRVVYDITDKPPGTIEWE